MTNASAQERIDNGAGNWAVSRQGHYVIVSLRATFVGSDENGATLDTDASFHLIDAQGTIYDNDTNADGIYLSMLQGKFQFDQVAPRAGTNGVYVYDVPRGVGKLVLEVEASEGSAALFTLPDLE